MPTPISFDMVESCNICNGKEFDFFLQRGDLYTTLPGLFTVVRCRNCGLLFQNPRPSQESWDIIYPPTYGQYIPGLMTEKPFARFSRKYGLSKRANFVKKYKPSGHLLDVGCSTGDFLEVMQHQDGWTVAGIEPHPEASQYARSLGLDVHTGTLEDLKSSNSRYDAITMWHVIEHFYDPKSTLESVYHLLKPNGIVIITTPNFDSLDARLFGQYWTGFELPRHFYVFSKGSMQELFERTGFKLLDMRCFYGTHAAFMTSVKFYLRRTGKRHTTIENLLFSLPVRILLAPFFYVIDKLRLSSPVTYIGVKL